MTYKDICTMLLYAERIFLTPSYITERGRNIYLCFCNQVAGVYILFE